MKISRILSHLASVFLIGWLPHLQAQDVPITLQVLPISDKLTDHRWSYKQGLEFDIADFKTSSGQGIRMYVGVSPSTQVRFTDFITGVWKDKPIKLYKKCKNTWCDYTTLLNSIKDKNGRTIWVKLWINTPEEKTDMYLNWLMTLKFTDSPAA